MRCARRSWISIGKGNARSALTESRLRCRKCHELRQAQIRPRRLPRFQWRLATLDCGDRRQPLTRHHKLYPPAEREGECVRSPVEIQRGQDIRLGAVDVAIDYGLRIEHPDPDA